MFCAYLDLSVRLLNSESNVDWFEPEFIRMSANSLDERVVVAAVLRLTGSQEKILVQRRFKNVQIKWKLAL
jgi:hypothetical protein